MAQLRVLGIIIAQQEGVSARVRHSLVMNKALAINAMEVDDDAESRYHWRNQLSNQCFGSPHGELLRDKISEKAA